MNKPPVPSRMQEVTGDNPAADPGQPSMSFSLGGHALLIGVESYRAHDASGQSDLPAGRNDVRAMYRLARKLGFCGDRIHVLTSPRLSRADILEIEQLLDPDAAAARLEERAASVEVHEASRKNILEGVEWLSAALQTGPPGARRIGLMTFSGHGTRLGGQLALCPSDVSPSLVEAVRIAELGQLLRGPAAEDLTVVLDCCFSEKTFDRAGSPLRLSSLRAREEAGGAAPPDTTVRSIAARVFSAARHDENAYQSRFGGRWHGAFTWAFTVALDQWQIVQEEHFKRSTVSHGELLRRTRLLLDALDFPQSPTLAREDEVGALAMFQRASRSGAETAPSPDRHRPSIQLDPTSGKIGLYRFFHQGTPRADVYVTSGAPPDGLSPYTEYWVVQGEAFDTTLMGTLTILRASVESPPSGLLGESFSVPQQASWQEMASDPTGIQVGSYRGEQHLGRPFGFTASLRKELGTWRGAIVWYNFQASSVFADEPTDTQYELTSGQLSIQNQPIYGTGNGLP